MTTAPAFFDVVVLGGGPAGAATALSLRRTRPELSVAVVEAADFTGPRIGETLPPSATPLLRQLGLLEQIESGGHLPVFSTSAAWGSNQPLPNEYFSQLYSRGWHLERNRFDRTLLHAAEVAGAVWLRGKMHSAQPLADRRWSVKIQGSVKLQGPVKLQNAINTNSCAQEKPISHIQTKFIVDATGRRAIFARQQGIKPIARDRLIGAVRFFSTDKTIQEIPESLRSVSTLIESCVDGWWYSAVLPDRSLVVVAMTDADVARRLHLHKTTSWEQWIAGARYTRQRLREHKELCNTDSVPIVRSAATQALPRCTGDNWLAVGDAASCVDPLSSQGITRALSFGIYASYAICDWFAGKKPGLAQYQAMVRAEFQDYLIRRQAVYRDEQRWAQHPFWVRRH